MKIYKYTLISILFFTVIYNFNISYAENINELKNYSYSSRNEIVEIIKNKIKNEQYTEIEKYIDELMKKNIKNEHVKLLDFIYNNVTEDISIEELNKWCKKSNHHSPLVFRAYYFINTGWKIRGSGYTHTVSNERFKEFKKMIVKAKNDLEKSYKINPKDTSISYLMMRVCKDLGLGTEEMEKWFKRGIQIDPNDYSLYSVKLHFINPHWYGTAYEYYDYAKFLHDNPKKDNYSDTLILDALFLLFYTPKTRKIYANELAIANIEKITKVCLERHPGSKMVQIRSKKLLGAIQFLNESYDKAEKNFMDIIELDEHNSWPWFMLGQLYYKHRNKPAESMHFFDKAIEINDDPWYRIERGLASLRAGLYIQCIEDFDHAISWGYSSEKISKGKELCLKKLKNQ